MHLMHHLPSCLIRMSVHVPHPGLHASSFIMETSLRHASQLADISASGAKTFSPKLSISNSYSYMAHLHYYTDCLENGMIAEQKIKFHFGKAKAFILENTFFEYFGINDAYI